MNLQEKITKKKIKSFFNSKKLFEQLKKNSNYNFNYYDMNNSVSSKAYFDKLREYGIDNKEWESIIKRVNLKESGLSFLFEEAKNTEGLARKWFLPVIEKKLNKEENMIKNYRDIIEKYIYQYKINKSDIDRKNKIEVFKEKADDLREYAVEFNEQINNQEQHKNKIANFYKRLSLLLKDKEDCLQKINDDILKADLESKDVEYEKKSIEIYSRLNKIKDLDDKISKNNESIENYSQELIKLKREKNILSCADIYRRYKSSSKRLQEIEIKIKVLKDKEKDKKPEINNLGYSIRKLLNDDYEKISGEKKQSDIEKDECIRKKKQLSYELDSFQKRLNEISREEGKLYTEVKSFDNFEDKFNRTYDENLQRNIVGYFDEEESLKLGRKINSDKKMNEEEKIYIEKLIMKNNELLKSRLSEKDKLKNKAVELNIKLENIHDKIENFEKELNKRREIIKYVNLDESNLFDNYYIIDEFNKKISLLDAQLHDLYKEEELITKEINKLKDGKIVEIPEEFLEALRNNDIEIIYGMEWLKKNQYSVEDNRNIVKKNPFIPYSLIMDKKDISALTKSDIDIYTSFPIPIIEREMLSDVLKRDCENIIYMDGIRFFVSFNNKLLDEEELKKLLKLKEEEKINLQKKIGEKKEALNLYNDKKGFIKNSKLTRELYESALNELNCIKNSVTENKENLISIQRIIAEINDEIIDEEEKKDKLKDKLTMLTEKEKDYEELISQYEEYCLNKENYENILERKEKCKLNINNHEKNIKDYEENIELLSEKLRNLQEKIKWYSKELSNFKEYNEGTFIHKDLEDMLAQYDAVNKEIYGDISDFEKQKKDIDREYNENEEELIAKQKDYDLEEDEFKNVIYDYSKETSIRKSIDSREKDIKKLERESESYRISKNGEEINIENLKKGLLNLVNTDVPKEKNKIFNKNFDEILAEIKIKKEDLDKNKSKCERQINKISINKSSLDEYDFKAVDEIDINIDLKELDDTVKKMKRDYNTLNEKIEKARSKVSDYIIKIANDDTFSDDTLFKDAIAGLEKVCSNPENLLNQLKIVLNSYNMIVEKLMHDLDMINKEEENILDNLYEYMSLVNENINKLDDNSAITVNGKSIKMLKISVAELEENKELYRIRIKDYIESIRNHCVNLLENNESIKEYIEKSVNIIKLYDEIISLGNIHIKLYKIEENKQKQITWDEVSTNSGGEGFLSAFVILSSLLSYMRKEEKDIFTRKQVSKVLIMDNPFAQTYSVHLLKPLIDISKKSRTQLICFTGLGGDAIINRFDNIYVLNLVSSKLKNGLKIIKSEHVLGDEEMDTIVASRIKSEEAQMKLF